MYLRVRCGDCVKGWRLWSEWGHRAGMVCSGLGGGSGSNYGAAVSVRALALAKRVAAQQVQGHCVRSESSHQFSKASVLHNGDSGAGYRCNQQSQYNDQRCAVCTVRM